MAERAQSPQNRRDQAPHLGAVAIGEVLQSGMRGGAIELLVERAVLMQNAIEYVRRDPPRRETGYLGGQGKSLWGHGAGTSCGIGQLFAFQLLPLEGRILLAAEYAKYKNRSCDFTGRMRPARQKLESSRLVPQQEHFR
jgi:hypothetical protein